MAGAAKENLYEVEDLLMQPGTYFNPQTEVLVVVDDSTSLDQEVFNMEAYEGAEWVRISDEVPVDEDSRDRVLESFQTSYHLGFDRLGLRDRAGAGRRGARRGRERPGPGARGHRVVLEAGASAPDFTLPDQDGNEVSLSGLKDQTVVLYFYPRADTPGCTTQACGVRDRTADYKTAGARVIGVSPDTVEAEKKFADKFDLDFALLADADHAVAERYGTWVEKSMYGKKYMGVQRATFIVDPEGKIAKVFPKVSPKTHDEVVLAALGELAAP